MSAMTPPEAPPPPGKKWWCRPAYFFMASGGGQETKVEWTCPFCRQKYVTSEDYMRPGFVCECGARFLEVEDPGMAWMWGLEDEGYNPGVVWYA